VEEVSVEFPAWAACSHLWGGTMDDRVYVLVETSYLCLQCIFHGKMVIIVCTFWNGRGHFHPTRDIM